MSKTRIFVSSTCFDLAAVREDLRSTIITLGHEPLLSEYSSFPVSPEHGATENCRRNVREHTDLLVLIVGGRRGYQDPATGKTVTNLEYEEARRGGLPTFVFIKASVLNLVRVWKKNPQADFTPDVDYPEVFAFIERIRAKGGWTFSFERTEDIKEVLRTQLSVFLRDLLDRRRGGRLTPLPEFQHESARARELALDKPPYWEFLLTTELLTSKLAPVRRHYDEVIAGRAFRKTHRIEKSECPSWIQSKMIDSKNLYTTFDPTIREIVAAWGPPGQPGDAIQIKATVEKMVSFAQQLTEWEADLRSAIVPEVFQKLTDLLKGWTNDCMNKLESIAPQITAAFKENPAPRGSITIVIKLDDPTTPELFTEIERLTQQPWLWS